MKILHLSDTHNKHWLLNDLPAADVIVHSGDASEFGQINEIIDFFVWFGALDYKYKIFVAGNHDACLHNEKYVPGYLSYNSYYLCNSVVTLDGVKFWGVPYFINKGLCRKFMLQIPADTDILVTHRPPFRILDRTNNSYGCVHLMQAVWKIAPRYHLFGHVHGAYGIQKSNETTFVNASLLNEDDKLTNKPVVIEIES